MRDFFSVDRLLTAFSLKRNWYRLISDTKPEHRNLRSMNAIKTIVMFLITNGHVLWFILALPMKNPLFVEQVTDFLMFLRLKFDYIF